MVTFCRMQKGDAEEIKNWPPYDGVHSQMDYALRDQGWLDVFGGDPDTVCYSAFENGKLVGFGLFIGLADETEMRLAVHPDWLSKGVGGRLAESLVVAAFDEHVVSELHLIVRKNNLIAQDLYKKMGFSFAGETTRLIMGTNVPFFKFVMSRDQFIKAPCSKLRGMRSLFNSKEENKMTTALVLIDLQCDYFPGGRKELPGSVDACRNGRLLLAKFRERGLPVIHVQHIANRSGATFFLPNTEGVEIHPDLQPLNGEQVIEKHFPNSFRDTVLDSLLRKKGVIELVMAGMMSQMCVDATVRAAFDLGYSCRVAHDACAAAGVSFEEVTVSDSQVHAAIMAALAAVYARVDSSSEILDDL